MPSKVPPVSVFPHQYFSLGFFCYLYSLIARHTSLSNLWWITLFTIHTVTHWPCPKMLLTFKCQEEKSEENNKQRTEMQKERHGKRRRVRIHHLSNRVKLRLNSGSPDTEKGLTSDYDDKWPLQSITHEQSKTSRITTIEPLCKYRSILKDRTNL